MNHDLTRMSAGDLGTGIANGTFTSEQVTQAHLDRIAEVDGEVHAFLHVDAEAALAQARAVDADLASGRKHGPLAGVPIAIKDAIATRGMPTTCGSKILQGWVPPYDATVITRLREAGCVLLGKTNMDEFAMGSSTEHSAYGPTRNPWDLDRIPGGSGGGSAAAVGSFQAPLALGSDTGGSIRQPAAVTGTVGTKPTYGSVSRYGLVAMASSLDQIGPVTRSVVDAALLHAVIGGHDPHDSTSLTDPVESGSGTSADLSLLMEAARSGNLEGLRVGVVKELGGEGFQAGVQAAFNHTLELLTKAGADVVEVSCPNAPHALAAYYLIMPSEASSNLARFDAMRYGLRVGADQPGATAEKVMSATRDAGFGDEVKRRIILGTYALSAGYYDAYYGSAQKVRTLVQQDFSAAFEKVDVLVSPTSPTTAFRLGERLDDPMAMYLNDVATIPANLAGIPGLSIPCGLAEEDGLPVGLQILAPARGDARLYRVGAGVERLLEAEWGGPILNRLPDLSQAKVA